MTKTSSVRTSIAAFAFITLSLFACERKKVDYAAKSETNTGTAIQYAANPHVYAVENPALVRDVLPQGDEGINGEALFVKSCSACHQITGAGVPGAFPPLANSPYVTGDKTDRLAAIMLYGLMGPIKVNGIQYNNVMAPWGGALNDQELAAIATYIRSAWGNKAPAVDASVFAAARTKWGSRGQFNIQELGEEN